MNILGSVLNDACERFLLDASEELPALEFHPATEGPSRVRGTYWGASSMIGGIPHVWVDTELEGAAFSHTLAHEVDHMLQRVRRFPEATLRHNAGEGWQRVISVFREVVECTAIDVELRDRGLDPSYSISRRSGVAVGQASHPLLGTATVENSNFVRRVLVLTRAILEQPNDVSKAAARLNGDTHPMISRLAADIAKKIQSTGLGSREQRWESMSSVQSALSLVNKVIITDPVSGRQR